MVWYLGYLDLGPSGTAGSCVWAFFLFLALRVASSIAQVVPGSFPSSRRGSASKRFGIQGLIRLHHPSILYSGSPGFTPLKCVTNISNPTAVHPLIAESLPTLRNC